MTIQYTGKYWGTVVCGMQSKAQVVLGWLGHLGIPSADVCAEDPGPHTLGWGNTPLLCRSSGSSSWRPQNHCMIHTLPAPRQKKCKHTNTKPLRQCSQQHRSWSWGQSKCPSVTYGQMLCLHDRLLLVHKRTEELLHEQMDFDCITPQEGRQRKTATCPINPHTEIVWNR